MDRNSQVRGCNGYVTLSPARLRVLSAVRQEPMGKHPPYSQTAAQGLARLALRWPDVRERLATVSDPTGDFESLCAAYEEACRALDYWRRSPAENAGSLSREYQDLVQDLEAELKRRVNQTTPRDLCEES